MLAGIVQAMDKGLVSGSSLMNVGIILRTSASTRLEADLKFLSHRPKNGSQVVHAWITCR